MRTLSSTLAAILVSSLAACSGGIATVPNSDAGIVASDAGLPPTPLDETVTCLSPYGERPQLYAALTLASSAESLTFFEIGFDRAPDGGAVDPKKEQTIGATCDAACQEKVFAEALKNAAAQSPAGWSPPSFGNARPSTLFAVHTKGDVHTLVTTFDALQALVAPIETLREAQAWATLRANGATCEGANNASQKNAAYYELRFVSTTCQFGGPGIDGGGSNMDITTEVIYLVYKDGRIDASEPRELRRAPALGCSVAGRNPVELKSAHQTAMHSAYANYLAEMAHLESAAVHAFGELATELERFGAPHELVVRARKAQADERRHTAVMQQHARSAGVRAVDAVAAPRGYDSLLSLALHNAEEGCVRETYGALVAMHQATRATNAGLRADLQTIAKEEVEHAEWSRDLDAWLMTQLSAHEQAQVAGAKQQAFERLVRENQTAPALELVTQAGFPTAEVAAHLLAGLHTVVTGQA
jgi:hypothetical protein